MATLARLVVELEARVDRFTTEIDKAEARLRAAGETFERVGLGLTTRLTLPLAAAGAAAIKLAADATEAENLFEVAMGDMAGAAREFSEVLSEQLGLNAFEVRKSIGTFNQMFTAMGLGKEASLEMATGISQLSADMASFFNLDIEDAFAKLQSGISGEIEPLRRLGVLVDEQTVLQALLKEGIVATSSGMSQQQKVLGRYLAIVQQTGNAQGDLARTLDSPLNMMRIFAERARQVGIELGTALLPALKSFLGFANRLLDWIQAAVRWFANLPPAIQGTIVAVLAFVAALGPALIALGAMIKLFAALKALAVAGAVALNPITLLIGSLAALAFVLIRNWTDLKIFWLSLWDALQTVVQRGILAIVSGLAHLTSFIPILGDKLATLRDNLETTFSESQARRAIELDEALAGLAQTGAEASEGLDLSKFVIQTDFLADAFAQAADAGAALRKRADNIAEALENLKTTQDQIPTRALQMGSAFDLVAEQADALEKAINELLDENVQLDEVLNASGLTLRDLVEQYRILNGQVERAKRLAEEEKDFRQEIASILALTETNADRRRRAEDLLQQAVQRGVITSEEYFEALTAVGKAYKDTSKDAEMFEAMVKRAAENAQDAMADFFKSIFRDGELTFSRLVDRILDLWFDMVAQIAATQLAQSLNLGSIFGNILASISGSVAASPTTPSPTTSTASPPRPTTAPVLPRIPEPPVVNVPAPTVNLSVAPPTVNLPAPVVLPIPTPTLNFTVTPPDLPDITPPDPIVLPIPAPELTVTPQTIDRLPDISILPTPPSPVEVSAMAAAPDVTVNPPSIPLTPVFAPTFTPTFEAPTPEAPAPSFAPAGPGTETTPIVVNQEIRFEITAMADRDVDAVIQARMPAIAKTVADAVREVPGFRQRLFGG